MRQKIILAVCGVGLLAGLGSAIADHRRGPKVEADRTIAVADRDPAMRDAFAKARQSLPQFFERISNGQGPSRDSAVKVGVKVANGFEFIWLRDPRPAGDSVSGIVANAPHDATDIHEGDRISYPRAKIVDWMYRDGDRLIGNYTACALATHQPVAEQAAFVRRYGLDCSSNDLFPRTR